MSVTILMIPEARCFITSGTYFQFLDYYKDFTTTLHSTTVEEHGEGTHKAGGATYYQLSMEGNHDNPMILNYQEPSLTMNLFFSGKVNVYYIPP